MITLRKKETIELFHVELTLKEKTKQNPFIAVLILASEQGEITPESLRQNLLTSLPIRACANLLLRISQQGYLERINGNSAYTLTELGEQSAIDKSFWVGEKGVYSVFVASSVLIDQQIILIKKTERFEYDRNGNWEAFTPSSILEYQNEVLKIEGNEKIIEEVEAKCFKSNSIDCVLEIQASKDECLLKVLNEKEVLFQNRVDINEQDLKEDLLLNTNEFEYNERGKNILVEFDPNDISFLRKVSINSPYFQGVGFSPLEIENVWFMPLNQQNAEMWLLEILYKGIDSYFLDDYSFESFAKDKAKHILSQYNVEIPTRNRMKQLLAEKPTAFYQTAKLETIDYLNY